MKKALFILCVLALSATASQAQEAKAKAPLTGSTFGVKLGVGFQNFIGKESDGSRSNYEMGIKWNAGVNMEVPIATDFYFQPGLSLVTKGAKIDATGSGTSAQPEFRFNLYYLDIPLNFVYKAPGGSGAGHFIAGIGPYVGFGIGGKGIQENSNGSDTEYDVEYRGTVTAAELAANPTKIFLKRTDAGANIMLGYEFASRFSVMAHAQVGLSDIQSKFEGASTDKSETKNLGFGLNFGYRFAK